MPTTPTTTTTSPRIRFGLEKLGAHADRVRVGTVADASILAELVAANVDTGKLTKEGYAILSRADGTTLVAGADESGAMYGCVALAKRAAEEGGLPKNVNVVSSPLFTLRGPAIGMQKTYILPGRKVYEYPYTPELFPWFYDAGYWTTYLDSLVDQRFNSLFLWNGHPFASLVRVKDYPFAQEVDDATFEKNVAMFRHITTECERRGIWLVQMFYNILLPEGFAKHYGIETQLAAPTPEAEDYTRKSIAEFVRSYPSVGLMFSLGEALQVQALQTKWCTDVILAGVKDGMAQANLVEEPPVVIRTHATNARIVMPEALKVYKNLYTEAKFNGESLTTWEPRGVRQSLHQAMSQLGSTHLINVHVLANLEPFRYGAQRFIKKCMQAARERLGAHGLHLYPLAYWDWPVTPDVAEPALKQPDRDWIWFEAWARYAWDPYIDDKVDHEYWADRLATVYGSHDAAELILNAYNDSGECAPRILRRYGITEGNRQTMSLGMTLDQLVNPERARPFPELWESQSPPGERLQEFVEKELKGQPHEGETPVSINDEVLAFSAAAVRAIDAAAEHVHANVDEYRRLRNDVHCIRAMTLNYVAKTRAAIHVLRYNANKDAAEMEKAEAFLKESLEHFRELTKLTEKTYRYANTMQTGMRRVPVMGGFEDKPANYHWTQLLPVYEVELEEFSQRVADIRAGKPDAGADEAKIKRLTRATLTLLSPGVELYEVNVGSRVWQDRPEVIDSIAPELAGLIGIRVSQTRPGEKFPPIEVEAVEPMRILVGYIKDPDAKWAKVPDLETDAPAADFFDPEPYLQNAVAIRGLPPIDVYAWRVPAGKSTLDVRNVGTFVVLGITPQSAKLERRDARRGV